MSATTRHLRNEGQTLIGQSRGSRLAGRVVANGRPGRYGRAIGTDVSGQSWFRQAMATVGGGEYSMADIAVNPALDGALVATYATAIREGGEAAGRPLGVLGIFFDWQPQADAVVRGVRLRPEERARSRCLLVDRNLKILAASDGAGLLRDTIRLESEPAAIGAYTDADGTIVGYARTSGYETYRGMGWYGVIQQRSH